MHDGESTTLRDAILRHREEAYESAHRFERMSLPIGRLFSNS
jgi:hypothetical protein